MASDASNRLASRIFAMKHSVRRNEYPKSIKQDLISLLANAALHAPTIGNRAAGPASIRPLQALEPRRKRRISVRRRRALSGSSDAQENEGGGNAGTHVSHHGLVSAREAIQADDGIKSRVRRFAGYLKRFKTIGAVINRPVSG